MTTQKKYVDKKSKRYKEWNKARKRANRKMRKRMGLIEGWKNRITKKDVDITIKEPRKQKQYKPLTGKYEQNYDSYSAISPKDYHAYQKDKARKSELERKSKIKKSPRYLKGGGRLHQHD